MKIAILGAGAWGTALAIHTASRHEVSLWSRNLDVLASVRAQRVNQRYLPDVPVPEGIQMVGDLAEAGEGAELVVMATSVAGLQPVAEALAQVLGSRTPPPSPEGPMPPGTMRLPVPLRSLPRRHRRRRRAVQPPTPSVP